MPTTSTNPSTLLKLSFLCGIIFLFAFYDTITHHGVTGTFNQWILESTFVTSNYYGKYFLTLKMLSTLGGSSVFIVSMVLTYGYLACRRQWFISFYSIIVIGIILGITLLCKELIDSPRPLFPFDINSFPSGHTVRASVSCGLVLFLHAIGIIKLPRTAIYLLIVIPLVVGYTRIGLGKHWPSDVIASYALTTGLFSLAGCLMLHKLRLSKTQ